MNEYQLKFNQMFNVLETQLLFDSLLVNYLNDAISQGIKSPFSEENKEYYLDKLSNCEKEEEYLEVKSDFLKAAKQFYFDLQDIVSSKKEESIKRGGK